MEEGKEKKRERERDLVADADVAAAIAEDVDNELRDVLIVRLDHYMDTK